MHAYYEQIQKQSLNAFNIKANIIEYNLNFPPHWHEEIELYYIMEGEYHLWVNKVEYLLCEGDIFLIGSKAIHHAVDNCSPIKKIMIQFNFSFLQQLGVELSDFNESCMLLKNSIHINATHPELKIQIQPLIVNIVNEMQTQALGYQSFSYASVYQLLGLMLRNISKTAYIPSNSNAQKHIDCLEYIFQYVKNHYHEHIPIKQIALNVNFHPNYFIRYFKNQTGMTFKEYLTLYRIEKAKELLYHTNNKMIDISMQCGFNSVKTFNRVFKMHTSHSPTHYKKLLFENNSDVND